MKKRFVLTQLLAIFTLFTFGYINSSVPGQVVGKSNITKSTKGQAVGESNTVESANYRDPCTPIMDEIKQLLQLLEKVYQDLSSLRPPKRSPSETDEEYELRFEEFRQKIRKLQERQSGIENSIYKARAQLKKCIKNSETSLTDKDLQLMQKKINKQKNKTQRMLESHKKTIIKMQGKSTR
jgi:chromosome segregation ATPase